jgi:DnaJ-domain-containing protein 1
MDRAAPGWREEDSASPDGGMTRAAALALLGLAEGAVPAEIRAAHRRLMRAAHPDRGGDAALAARLNQARDLLLDGTAH